MANNTTEKKSTKKACLKCNREQAFSNFYSTTDKDYYIDGKLPVCKSCCQKNIEEKGFDGFQTVMRMINKPIYTDLFNGDYFEYIKNLNSLPQYRQVFYNDSDMFQENKSLELTKRAKPKELTEDELRDSEDYWGLGYTEQDYQFLNNELSEFGAQYDITGKAMENLIREICLTQLDIRNKRSNKQDVKNELKTLQDLLGSSNLKPMQESGSQAIDQESFGTLIKKYENERPIPEPSPEWADVDGIGKYIRTFFLGHMAKMFNKENQFQEEYDEIIGEYTVNPRKDEDD